MSENDESAARNAAQDEAREAAQQPAPQATAKPGAAQPSAEAQSETLFESASAAEGQQLILALGSYEGPLDLLLDLARSQKVDLHQISILELAEQYLIFINEAKKLKLSLAAEYLVMAAWLAYLKSRLLLPKPPEDDQPSGEELAAHLAFQLERLQAMRKVAQDLLALPQLGRSFFGRGEPERRQVTTRVEWAATQHELLMAYARQRTKENFQPLHLQRRAVVAIDDALLRLRRILGDSVDWVLLESFLPEEWRDEDYSRSAIASTFAASLELAKHGQVILRQEGVFSPIYICRLDPDTAERQLAEIRPAGADDEQDEASDEKGGRRRRKKEQERGSAA